MVATNLHMAGSHSVNLQQNLDLEHIYMPLDYQTPLTPLRLLAFLPYFQFPPLFFN